MKGTDYKSRHNNQHNSAAFVDHQHIVQHTDHKNAINPIIPN